MNNSYNLKYKILFLIICSLFLTGCHINKEPISRSATFFDTFITITIYDCENESILNECFSICDKYEKMFSITYPESDISKINNSHGQAISVNKETINLVKDSLEFSKATNGMYDITIYSVSKLWDFHNPNNTLPNKDDIDNTVRHINYKNIVIDEESSSIALTDPDTQLDLGSIAKGYIADSVYNYLKSQGIGSAIINLGGDIRVLGCKPDNKPYIIGVQDPGDENNVITTLSINDKSVTTSGTYERFIMHNDKKYHHILNPLTGYPVDTDISSVTIIADSAETADALSTSVILLGKDNALPFIESYDNAEAIIITYTNDIFKTSGVDTYIAD